jgi:hypothetical protein
MTIMALSFLLVQYAVGEILVLAFFIPYGVGLEPNSGQIIPRYQRLRASRKEKRSSQRVLNDFVDEFPSVPLL